MLIQGFEKKIHFSETKENIKINNQKKREKEVVNTTRWTTGYDIEKIEEKKNTKGKGSKQGYKVRSLNIGQEKYRIKEEEEEEEEEKVEKLNPGLCTDYIDQAC